jgi:5-formyltetrahydrofolate cyclo-ligase
VEEMKASLRREFREARLGFAKATGELARVQIETNIMRLIRDLSEDETLCGLYRSTGEEAPAALEPVHRFFYPRIKGEELQFLRPKSGKFIKNKFGIEEPDPKDSEELPKGRHIIFTPAVAVDAQGGRLGMGRGYYDRFFQRHPEVIRVGVVFQVQMSKGPLPREEWDQALDWIVTEQMILETSTRSS